jgi:hypothetical protein
MSNRWMQQDIMGDAYAVPHDDVVRDYTSAATSSESAEWYTPDLLLAPMFDLFDGPPSLDPASCAMAQERVQALVWMGLEHPDLLKRDGIVCKWTGRVFLNWPGGAGNALRWARKLREEVRSGRTTEAVVVLFRHDHTTAWWRVLVDTGAHVCLVGQRVPFYRADGEGGGNVHPSSVAYVGDRFSDFQRAFGHLGAVVPNECLRVAS